VSAKAEIIALDAPVADTALGSTGGGTGRFASKAAPASASCRRSRMPSACILSQSCRLGRLGDTVLLAARLTAGSSARSQLGLDTPPISRTRRYQEIAGASISAWAWRWRRVDAQVEEEARRYGRWLLCSIPCRVRTVSPLCEGGVDPHWIIRTMRCFRMAGFCDTACVLETSGTVSAFTAPVSGFPLAPLPSPTSPACG